MKSLREEYLIEKEKTILKILTTRPRKILLSHDLFAPTSREEPKDGFCEVLFASEKARKIVNFVRIGIHVCLVRGFVVGTLRLFEQILFEPGKHTLLVDLLGKVADLSEVKGQATEHWRNQGATVSILYD